MNWKQIVTHGFAVSLVQLGAGFAQGYFHPQSASLFSVFSAISFLACLGIFFHLGANQVHRPFMHGCLALGLYAVVSLVFAIAAERVAGSVPAVLVAIEWLGLVVAAILGVTAGRVAGRRPRGGA